GMFLTRAPPPRPTSWAGRLARAEQAPRLNGPSRLAMQDQPKRVAAIVTEYRRWSHADVIVGKIIEGFNYDGKERPRMRVVSMFVDQFPERDMSRDLAKKFNFRIYDTIEGAITLGKQQVGVNGVLCIGEHGKYPTNERGQILYQGRRF